MSTFYPHYASTLAVGLSNPPGPFHVMLNGNSNALTVNSNAYVGIGKSNAAFALDVVGSINCTGSVLVNGSVLSTGNGIGFATSYTPAYAYYTSTSAITVASVVTLVWSASTIVQNFYLDAGTSTKIYLNGPSTSYKIDVTGVYTGSGGPTTMQLVKSGTNIVSELITSQTYTPFAMTAMTSMTSGTDYLTVTCNSTILNAQITITELFTNTSLPSSFGSGAVCQALWYASSNTPSANYVGTATYGGTIVQNNSTTSTSPFAASTGLFTCQYTGTYQCNFTSTTVVPQAAVTIYRNGAVIAPGYLTYGNVNNAISLSASIYCNAADTLGFYVTSGTIQGGTVGSTQGCSISLITSGSAATGMGVPNQVVFTTGTAQTWTVPTGVTQIQIEAVGAGGAGGYGTGTAGSTCAGGGGGGAGGYIRATLPVSAGSNITYSIGAGGTAATTAATGGSGGNTTIAYGGNTATASGGAAAVYSAPQYAVPGGSGGTPSIGTLAASSSVLVSGGAGGSGELTTCGGGGNGGASYFGGGGSGAGVPAGVWQAAGAGQAYGSGGGGGAQPGGSYTYGAAGAGGVVIITYFTQSGLPVTYTATAPLSMSGTTLSVAAATSSSTGVVQVDGTSIVSNAGVISASTPVNIVSASGALTPTGLTLIDSRNATLSMTLPAATTANTIVELRLMSLASMPVTITVSSGGSFVLNPSASEKRLLYTSSGTWIQLDSTNPSYFPTTQQGSKLVGTGASGNANQGTAVVLSADGNTMAVSGYSDAGIGATWIFTRTAGVWSQQGSKLVGSTAVAAGGYGPTQGSTLAISADGNTLVIGSVGDNSFTGAAYVFTRSAGVWTQQGSKFLPPSGSSTGAQQPSLGASVSLSADGNTMAIGAYQDGGNVGATWIYTRSAGAWTVQSSKLVGSGYTGACNQGISVKLSADGNTLAVGGSYDNSNIGATWIFTRSGTTWTQQGSKLVGTGYVTTNTHLHQGQSISLSADGNTLAVGAVNDNNNIGATWIFIRSGGVWTQQGSKLVGTGYTGSIVYQGSCVYLTADGNTLAVGGYYDNTGIGATWIFTRNSAQEWTQQGVKLTVTGMVGAAQIDQAGCMALSADGNTLAVGGPQDNNNIGAAWVFT